MFKLVHIVCFLFLLIAQVQSQILIQENQSPENLVKKNLIGKNSGIKIEHVKYTGHEKSLGAYATFSKYMPIASGIVLSTGLAKDVDGPNKKSNTGTKMFSDGDTLLQKISKRETLDASVLEFVFYPNTTEISFEYSFASEEYPEYVNKGVSDVFGFFITGANYSEPTNLGLIPFSNDAVSVDNVNADKNSQYFLKNMIWNSENMVLFKTDPEQGERAYNCEFDGMTIALTAKATVIPYKPYVLKFAIADVGDNLYDSGVFIKKGSLKSRGDTLPLLSVIEHDLKLLGDSLSLVKVKYDNNEIKIISSIKFDFNSHELSNEYTKVLNKLVVFFKQYFDLKIRIEGHADNVGDQDYNLGLSQKRAENIYNYLLNEGVDKTRLSFVGWGNMRPIYKGNNDEKKAINRRVEFILH